MEDKKKAEYLKGMFSNCTFNDSVVAGIAESGSEVFYEKTNEPKKGSTEQATKETIMEYVGRLKSLVKDEYQERYEEIWMGILDLSDVRKQVFNKGKQKDTTFNRNLVAQITHLMMEPMFVPSVKVAQMAEQLEPEKGVDHPVRKKLGESPEKKIKTSVEDYLSEIL